MFVVMSHFGNQTSGTCAPDASNIIRYVATFNLEAPIIDSATGTSERKSMWKA